MRYMVYFRDKSTMHVSQQVGEMISRAKMSKAPGVIVNGACISTDFILIVKPIKAGWFGKDFIAQQERIEKENPHTIKLISAPASSHD